MAWLGLASPGLLLLWFSQCANKVHTYVKYESVGISIFFVVVPAVLLWININLKPIPTIINTYYPHHKLILSTYDRMVITAIHCCVIQTRGVCTFWAGPDHHTSHYYIHHRHINTCMLSRVWALRATWMSCDMISRDWANTDIHTWATRGELYELIIRQDDLDIHARLPGVDYILQLIYTWFPGWAMCYKWASSWSV